MNYGQNSSKGVLGFGQKEERAVLDL
jgi:hypothetical protein